MEDKILEKIEEVCKNPYIGKKKRGRIDVVYSHKFYHIRTQYIITYEIIETDVNSKKGIEFLRVDGHGDDYKSIERYKSTSKRKNLRR